MNDDLHAPPGQFKCAQCGGTFEKTWSDDEAMEEADELWGEDLGDDPAVVCEDCFQAMTAVLPPKVFRSWSV